MSEPEVFPILLSLEVAGLALVVVTPIGMLLAYLQARRRNAFSWVLDALILLPLVLPPSVVGFFLVAVLGREGVIGQWLESWFGVQLVFTPAAAVISST